MPLSQSLRKLTSFFPGTARKYSLGSDSSHSSRQHRRHRLRRLLHEQMEDRRLLTTIDLGSLMAGQGTTIFGADADDRSGVSVGNVGDVNGDGFDDLLIGALVADAAGNAKSDAGESYLIYGAASLPATIDLANLGSAGIILFGADAGDRSGLKVSGVGDINGDGFHDLIIGAYRADGAGNAKLDSGESYLIFGGNSLPATIDLANLGSFGVTLLGRLAGDGSGRGISGAGDFNGDGFDDLLIGADGAGSESNASTPLAGASYVIFGAAQLPATITLGVGGITIVGVDASDRSGFSVSSAGDVNGDGFDDLVVGAYRADSVGNAHSDAGESYLIFGSISPPTVIDLANLGSAGITLFGLDQRDRNGVSVNNAGDVNGDGFDDLLIGADRTGGAGNAEVNAGESYLIFGAASLPETIDLANLGSTGITIFGADSGDQSGFSASSAGDINSDGFDDLIIGASFAGALNNTKIAAGESYVVFGAASLPPTIDLGNLGSLGMTLFGADPLDRSGRAVSGTGDVNGDGFDDLLIGVYRAAALGNAKPNAGESYVIFGSNDFTNSVAVGNIGTSGSDTLIGTSAANNLIGADGADTLVGGGGADVLRGGRGDDILAISDLTFQRIDGGTGIDTLRLDGSGITLNFSTIRSRIRGIEVIDITGSGDNTLNLTARDIVRLSDSSNTLTVRGNVGDRVIFGGFAEGAQQTIGLETFRVFTHGAATLRLSLGISIQTTSIDLAHLGLAGTTLFGVDTSFVGDRSGFSVSSAGDINGDGFDDLIIGAYRAAGFANNESDAGESYVIFGTALPPASIDLANLGSAGITIFGADAGDRSGFSVSSAGDVNGDGFDDLLIGANNADASENSKNSAGESYLIFGATVLPQTIDLANLGTAGLTLFGADIGDESGFSVSSAGDLNGDGFSDLLIGAFAADGWNNAKPNAGESYVVFGAALLPTTIDLANLGSAGITIFGAEAGDQFGFPLSGGSVSAAGDFNGDGFDDLLIGVFTADAAGNAKPDAGESYLIFGAASLPATIDLANLGSAGVTIFGAEAGDRSGIAVSNAGDVNGDGFDDLLIGADKAAASGNDKPNSGESYLIFGAASLPATIDLANLDSAGITLFGADATDASGFTVSGAGDINGDGFDDLLVGANSADAYDNSKLNAGESYLIFGAASLPTTIDTANLGSAGIVIFGVNTQDRSGRSVSIAGDFNGDGFDDLLIGADNADGVNNLKSNSGESYVILGGNDFTLSILAENLGTSADETIVGTSDAEILNGADGDDMLIGGGGADVLLGGRGDDVLAISDLNFQRIVGGTGNDTLRLDGNGMHLNLVNIPDNRIVDIEQIDITGSGNNTLTLNHREVLRLSSHSNTLVVRRNAGDVVPIGSGWTQQTNEVIGQDTFQVFTQGAAVLKLQLAAAPATIVGSFVNHVGYTGGGSSIDTGKFLAKESASPTLLTYDNLINSSRGINGLSFNVQNLASTVTAADFVFQMSPTGAFNEGANPVAGWQSAPSPSSISVTSTGLSTSTIDIQWPNNAIANRWLRVTVLANTNTGLATDEVYYIGHLLGETTGPSGTVFTVAFADITLIRGEAGTTVNASSIHDIDKSGTVSFADISAMRSNVGSQLTIITIPASGFSAPMFAGLNDDSSQQNLSGNRLNTIQLATPLVGSARNAELLKTPLVPDRQTQRSSLTTAIPMHGALQVASAQRPQSATVLKDRLFGEMESRSTLKTEAKAQTATESLARVFDWGELSQQKSELEALDAFFAKYESL